ncbi:MAG: dimethyl sulfoxide reductase anchor subunit [Gammaproteobacteria bacterium]|nr:dimethyl sulfoxide reductase anchor subunit [Gammaproteobacteria bacterium]
MHPAFSVIFLTTLIGAGQGLFLALFTSESYSAVGLLPKQSHTFYAIGGFLALLLLIAGLIASVFHLGRPERAWRAASQWRTSWLSREVIALPTVMGLVFLYATIHLFEWNPMFLGYGFGDKITLVLGGTAATAIFILFLCTGMIYAAIRFLKEWSNPLTIINFILFGGASGFMLASAYSSFYAPELVNFFGGWAIILTLSVWVTRSASLIRNARLKPTSTIQTAIGVRHTKIQQKAMGMMGGSFNTREYFHGKTALFLKSIKWIFIVLSFPLPILILWAGMQFDQQPLLISAFVIQYVGLLFERWLFFAQANHPQNIYYQTV